MELVLTQTLKAWLLPPGALVLLLAAGLWLLRSRPRPARWLLASATLTLWLLSTPWVAAQLLGSLERHPPLSREQILASQAQAIVVLGGGYHDNAPEYGGAMPSPNSLVRLHYAVRLHRLSGLPLLLSGGNADVHRPAEARLLARALREEYLIEPRWVEENSRNSAENARFSAELLKKDGIERILLVTQAWHLRRAVPQFEAQGLDVIAAPTGFEGVSGSGPIWADFLPSGRALETSYYALHEFLGTLWYRLRYP